MKAGAGEADFGRVEDMVSSCEMGFGLEFGHGGCRYLTS